MTEIGPSYSKEAFIDANQRLQSANDVISPNITTSELKDVIIHRENAEQDIDYQLRVAGDEADVVDKAIDRPISPETIEKRLSETKKLTEFWTDLGIDVDESDIKEKISLLPEIEGYDSYLYMPKGISVEKMSSLVIEKVPSSMVEFHPGTITAPRLDSEPYACAIKFESEADIDTKDQSVTHMNPSEYLVFFLRWYKENGPTVDRNYHTLIDGNFLNDARITFYVSSMAGRGSDWRNDYRLTMGVMAPTSINRSKHRYRGVVL